MKFQLDIGRTNPSENSWTVARFPREAVVTLSLETLKNQLDKLTLLRRAHWRRWPPEDLFNLNGSLSICCLETILTCQFKSWVGKSSLSSVTSGIYLLSGKRASGTVAPWPAACWVSDAIQIPPLDKLAADGAGYLPVSESPAFSVFKERCAELSSNIRKYWPDFFFSWYHTWPSPLQRWTLKSYVKS